MTTRASDLRALEADAIHVFREAAAQAVWPVLLYSIGKDSSVLLHLARKAFHPAPLPFPLLHVDTGWTVAQLYAFRDRSARMRARLSIRFLVMTNWVSSGRVQYAEGIGLHAAVDTWQLILAVEGPKPTANL